MIVHEFHLKSKWLVIDYSYSSSKDILESVKSCYYSSIVILKTGSFQIFKRLNKLLK